MFRAHYIDAEQEGTVNEGRFYICREFPGLLDDIRIWFRDYKKPDGKPENKFGFDDQWQNKEYTLKVSGAAGHICAGSSFPHKSLIVMPYI